MDFYSWNSRFSNLGSKGSDQLWENSGGFDGNCGNFEDGVGGKSQSLVLDEEKGELVKAQGKVAGKRTGSLSDEKAMAALKSHSEAERRRRERINAHLDTLRGLVPCTEKMDKATLLAEVICQVKQLQTTARQASKGLLIPEDDEEIKVEKLNEAGDDGSLNFRASVSCKYRPELLSDLRQALVALKVDIVRAELSTLGGRVKTIFDVTNNGNGMTEEVLLSSVRDALASVVEKMSISPEYSPRTTLPNKRRRYSLYDHLSSSS